MGWVVASTAKQAAAAAAAATRGTRWRWAVATAARGSPSALRAAARHDVAADGQRGTQVQTAGRAHLRQPATPAAHRMQLVAPDGPKVGRVRFFVGSRAGDRRGEGDAGDRGGGGESARGRFWGETGGEGRQWGWRGSHEGRASAAVATGCIVVAGGSALVLDFLRDQQRGPDERWGGVASLVFGSLLTRCESIKESWNLAAVKQKNKNNSTPRDPKALETEAPLAEDNRDIRDFYELGPELGAGVHAVVKRGKNKQTRELVAVKCVEKANMRRRQLAREIEILTTISHPNVISLKDVFEDEHHVYLVLELVQGGELFDKIVNDGAFSEREAAKLIRKITEALQYLHARKVCHRDLKPENLLLTSKGSDADVKIADFGLSKIMGEKTMMKRSCGTWAYWAPEILRRQPYDYSVDLWSVGVILYIMLSGIHPFDPDGQSSDAKIVERILRADYTFDPDYFAHVSPAAKDVVSSLIHMDPMQRLTCEQLLRHPWVSGTNVSAAPLPSVDNLQNFTLQNRKQFGQALVGIVASQALLRKVNRSQLFDSEIEEMRSVFMAHSAESREQMEKCAEETDGNCTLPALKLGATMRALGENISDRDAMRLALQSSIIDSRGHVHFSSFVGLLAHHVEGRETEEDLKRAFSYLDTQQKGVVSVSDIQRGLALMGVRMTETDVRAMVREVDTANKGKISFSQFQQLFRNVNQR